MTAVDALLELARRDTEAGRWLAGVLDRLAAGAGWEQATGLTPGRFVRALRDRHLLEVGRLLDWDAGQAALAAERFESRIWPAWRNRSTPPAHAEAVNHELFAARKVCGAPLPVSRRHFERIFKNDINTRIYAADLQIEYP